LLGLEGPWILLREGLGPTARRALLTLA